METAIQKFNLRAFDNPEFGSVRAVEIDGEGWLVGKDVAERLGYGNTRDALATHVDEDDKRILQKSEIATLENHIPKSVFPADFVWGDIPNRGLIIINESGLYSLVLRSNLPSARAFKRWVTSEVLPSIRRNGAFINFDHPDKASLIGLLRTAAAELEARDVRITELTATVAVKDQQLAEMRPKAGYYDVVLSCKDAIPISVIAKDYGMSAKTMNKQLADYDIQYKQSDIWLLKAKYQDKGYTCTKTNIIACPDGAQRSKIHTYWTQKGRLFIYDLLKKHGTLPLCEVQDDGIF